MAILEFKFKIGTTLTDPTSVVLSDPEGAYGIKRVDTNAKVVDAGTVMTRFDTGIYRYDFDIPVLGIDYVWYVAVSYGEAAYHFPRTFSNAGVTNPVNPYFSWEEFKRRWGIGNIVVASNKDNKNKDPDYDAVQDAFDYATDELHSAQEGGLYATPFDFSPNHGVVPRFVRNWGMTIAFEYLYNGRGLDDKNKVGNKLTRQLSGVYQEMALYRAGLRHMKAAPAVASDGSVISLQNSPIFAPAPHRLYGRCRRWVFIGGVPVYTGAF